MTEIIRDGHPVAGRTAREEQERQERNDRAARALFLRRLQRGSEERRAANVERIEREDRARRELEQHARDLAAELERARQRTQPNPWIRFGDEGYVSPLEFRLRQQLLQRSATRAPGYLDEVDRTLAQSRAELARQAAKPIKPAARRAPVRKTPGPRPSYQDVARIRRGR